MTGGQRQNMDVNDDFDVVVDGKLIEQLSGSTNGVANLALRLGLGKVLTRRTFRVFIGDEIDSFMDANRASLTNQTLRSLTREFDQVILITHEQIVADQVLDLGADDLSIAA